MRVEVDQSGKIGDTKLDTALAFSNDQQYSIFIPATVKRACIQSLRGSEKKRLETRYYIQLFSICLFLLLKNKISKLDQVVIDQEYPGHEAKIKEHLLNLLHRSGIYVDPTKIHFASVGKKSRAHRVALQTFKKMVPPDKIIYENDILMEFKK